MSMPDNCQVCQLHQCCISKARSKRLPRTRRMHALALPAMLSCHTTRVSARAGTTIGQSVLCAHVRALAYRAPRKTKFALYFFLAPSWVPSCRGRPCATDHAGGERARHEQGGHGLHAVDT